MEMKLNKKVIVLLTYNLITTAMTTTMALADADDAIEILPGCKHFVEITDGKSRDIYDRMTVPEAVINGMNIGKCLGIILGARYVRDIEHPVAQRLLGGDCSTPRIPQRINMGQLVRTVIRYLDKRPSRLHDAFISVAIAAFEEAWPCN
jgi:hypothetical protein